MSPLALLAALTPVLAVFVFLVILRQPAVRAMPISLVLTAGAALAVWRVPSVQAAAAALEGVVVAASILWILFGAMLLLNILNESGASDAIRSGFMHINPDRRVQAIIVAWLFGAFLEGAAGFGAPATITGPLLATLGFPPLAAVTLALTANSAPVAFGAVGTPILIGLGEGLHVSGALAPEVRAYLGPMPLEDFLQQVAVQITLFNLLLGTAIPLLMSAMLTRFFGERKSWREGLEIWPFALFAGLCYTVPALAVAALLGPEFPSILGGLVGLAVVVPAARRRFLLPAEPWRFGRGIPEPSVAARLSLRRAWVPYLLVAVLLVLTRVEFLPFKAWLQRFQIGWSNILGTEISASFAPLYVPGAVFVLVALLTIPLHGMRGAQARAALGRTGRLLLGTAVVLITSVAMVRIFINSEVNAAGLESMPIELANLLAATFSRAWPLAAPWVGALGSFISGSVTFSNLMFSLLQFGVAQQTGLPPTVVLTAQVLGAMAGNIICVVNVVAAASVVNLLGQEGAVIRLALRPATFYALGAGLLALLVTFAL